MKEAFPIQAVTLANQKACLFLYAMDVNKQRWNDRMRIENTYAQEYFESSFKKKYIKI